MPTSVTKADRALGEHLGANQDVSAMGAEMRKDHFVIIFPRVVSASQRGCALQESGRPFLQVGRYRDQAGGSACRRNLQVWAFCGYSRKGGKADQCWRRARQGLIIVRASDGAAMTTKDA